MEDVTAEQCKAVVNETGMTWLGHHRCGCCGLLAHERSTNVDLVIGDGIGDRLRR